MTNAFDAIVIGAGINGSSAALHLARAGKNTVLIDQFPVPHTRGSSTGQSRIFRFANSSFPAFTQIVLDTYKQWRDLEAEAGVSLLRTNKIITISKTSERNEMENMYQSVIDCGRTKPSWKSIEDLNKEYGTTFSIDALAIEDSNAGILMADRCVKTIQKLFESSGGKIIDEFPVDKILTEKNGPVTLEGPNGTIKGSFLIICAGPWTTRLLDPLGIHLPLKTIKIGVYYWKLLDTTKRGFTFIDSHEADNSLHYIYGVPAIEYTGLTKICYHDGTPCDPNNRDLSDMGWVKSKLSKYVASNFPWLHSEPAIEEACMYTVSPDHEMILDRHPSYKNIVYGCGFSGTGFKTGPAVGKILAEMVLGLKQTIDVSAYSASRFD